MSAHWTVYCETCEVYGPDIRRSSSVQLGGIWPRRHPDFDLDNEPHNADVQGRWADFLDEHEWHKLELHHE